MSARETLKKIAEDRRLFHLHPQDQDAIRTVLAELDGYEQTSGELCEVCGWRGIRADEGCAFCRLEQAERERDDARECSTLMERERDAARGRAADAEARIANNVRAYSAELESRTVALQQAEARIAALIEAGDVLHSIASWWTHLDARVAWENTKGGAK